MFDRAAEYYSYVIFPHKFGQLLLGFLSTEFSLETGGRRRSETLTGRGNHQRLSGFVGVGVGGSGEGEKIEVQNVNRFRMTE